MAQIKNTKNFEIAIIGGGIAGLTLAISLYHRGVPVKVYEAAHAFGEIGAGVSFTPNSIQSMKLCHDGIYRAFQSVCTKNVWPSKEKVWFDYIDGYNEKDEQTFTITNSMGQNGVHRAHFLDELVGLLPSNLAQFGKRLQHLEEQDGGKFQLNFEDGTTAQADAVIGCDGIKSRVRRSMFGDDHPCANPSYTHKYAYRALADMSDAIATIGEERAQNSFMHMGPGGHILTFPVNHGTTLNIVAFTTDLGEWTDTQHLTKPAKREDLLRDFGNYNKDTLKLLSLTKPELDIWAIFDLLQNPPPSYNKGRVCLVGDAAHATSPHHGAGAGLCIEDSAVLSELLADDRVTSPEQLSAVFATFDDQRRERGRFLVASSRFTGDCYEWQAEGVGRDFKKIETEVNRRNGIIANVDVAQFCDEAKSVLGEKLAAL